MIPPILIFLVLLMAPLRLSAMERLGNERNLNPLRASADMSDHERLATDPTARPDQDGQRNLTSSTVTNNHRQQSQISSAARGDALLQNLKRENEIHQQAVKYLGVVIQASRTRVCLSALNFFTMPMSSIAATFLTANQGANWENIPLILNNGELPVSLAIPASADQSTLTSIVPTIIPAGATTTIATTTIEPVTTTAPTRVPTPEENQQVRRLIKEALQVDYGADVSELFPDFDQVGTPLMASDISEIFSAIEGKYGEDELQNMTAAVQQSQIPLPLAEALVKHPSLAESDEVIRQKDQTLSNKDHENLGSSDKALARAAWHACETAARGAGVVGGTIAGVGLKAVASAVVDGALVGGPVVGGAAGAVAGGAAGAVTGAVFCAAASAVGGAAALAVFGGAAAVVVGGPVVGVAVTAGAVGGAVGAGFGAAASAVGGFGAAAASAPGFGAAAGASFGAVTGAIGAIRAGAVVADAFRLDRHETVAGMELRAISALISVSVGLPHSFAAYLAYSIGGAMVGGAVPLALMAAPDAARRALEYYAPGDALSNAREALHDWSGTSAGHALELMQEAQETDLQAMESLNDLFSSFGLVENAAFEDQVPRHFSSSASSSSAPLSSSSSASAAVAVEEAKADERAITPETLTPARVRDIFIGQIQLRIHDREALMTSLQNKIAAIAEKEGQARALYFNPENKARHGGRRI